MRRRLKTGCRTVTSSAFQEMINARQEALMRVIEGFQDVTTFSEIADKIGFSHEFVRQRLVSLYKTNPSTLFKVGKQYRVPRSTAVSFITSLFG